MLQEFTWGRKIGVRRKNQTVGEPLEPLQSLSLHSEMESRGPRPVFSPPRSVGGAEDRSVLDDHTEN